MDNVVGTCNILNYARMQNNLKNFVYFSTDEIFGPAPEGVNYKENDRYNSGNPYAAAKAGGEELAVAFHNTYNMPIMITHCMNVFGERQHPEKFIPLCVKNSYTGNKITIHANKSLTRAGSRYYIHAKNVCNAVDFLLKNGKAGEKYNIVGEKEVDNLTLAKMISKYVGKELNYEMVDFHSTRPGHDMRYALSGELMKSLGFEPKISLSDRIKQVSDWYIKNPKWLQL
jgi:dTDP-glucose 4,6-dehydratase